MTEAALLAYATLCNDSAEALSEQISALGPRPADPAGAARWSLSLQRLNGQINSLTRVAIDDSAEAVSDALKDEQAVLGQLQEVTAAAEKRIKAIEHDSALLTTVSRVLDVGLALLTAAHDPTTVPALIGSIEALSHDASA